MPPSIIAIHGASSPIQRAMPSRRAAASNCAQCSYESSISAPKLSAENKVRVTVSKAASVSGAS